MRGALEGVPGISKIDIEAGTKDFTVHYDGGKIKPDEMVKKLVAAGEDMTEIIN